jgi:hypothetical protein
MLMVTPSPLASATPINYHPCQGGGVFFQQAASEETDVRLVFCRDKAELASKLAESQQTEDDEEE